MVASKPVKAAKYTYAERVLQAFSQVHKKHRRHGIHMATLRAQVKKNAQAQQDKLGPQWPNWVTRAVHKLQDEGIFAADAPGSVVMTPTGKKAVAAARKSLPISVTSTPTATREESIWRSITRSQTTPRSRGVKRSRYNTFLPIQSVYDYSEDDDEDLQSSPSPHRRARAKRARPSTSLGKKPVSKMTKAELKAALKSLETEHANFLVRATSPLTDLDEEEERERLKSELKARDEELERIRRQLDEVRIQIAPSGTYRFDIDRASSPLYYGSTPSSSPLPAVQYQKRSAGVVLTQSGSFICDVSKQPTPAPSSPDTITNEARTLEEEIGNDVFGNHGESASMARMELHRSITPSPSPERTVTRDIHLMMETSRLKKSAEKRSQGGQEWRHVQEDKISVLEKTLDARLLEIRQQKDLHANLSEQLSQLEKKIADRDFRVSSLEQEVKTLRSTLSSSSSEVVSKDSELKNLRISKDALEASLSAQLHELKRAVGQREEVIALITDERNNGVKQLDTAQRQLQRAGEALEMYFKRLTLSQGETLRLRMDSEHARSELTVQQNQNVSLFSERASLEEVLKKAEELLNAERERRSTELSGVRDTLARRDLEAVSLTRELQESVARRHLLTEQLSELKLELNEAKSKAIACENESTEKQETIGNLQTQLADSQKGAKEAKRILETAEAQYSADRATYESTVAAMHESLANTRRENDGLSTQLKTAQTVHKRLQDEVQEYARELSDVQATIRDESLRASTLEAELAAAITRASNVEEEILDLRSSKQADERTIDSLKDAFTKLREAQMQSLTELGDKVYSAHSTPVSKSRLTSMAA
ncbi:hypothetical protein AX15_000999 [Amanita polypyramis BW_CC]|nr:hypothetical protein AX15_000999 [Amanita polypyramis BW_CC]